tara:strand:- start:1625 stop:2281 length:657 start_codon:yes stop_codon:yes gene_type:complete
MLLNRLPLFVAICLCLLISGALYWQLEPFVRYHFWPDSQNQSSLLNHNSMQNAGSNHLHNEIKQDYDIASFKLFGDVSAPAKHAPIETEKLPETSLRLRLTGVLAGKNNILASALIEGPDRKTRNYRIDEEVPGGATLKRVYHDRVVLERSGRLENLIFEETRPIGIETQARNTPPEPIARPAPGYSTNNMQNFNQQQTQQIKDRLSRLRSRLQNNGP